MAKRANWPFPTTTLSTPRRNLDSNDTQNAEVYGTGTAAGDSIEANAIAAALVNKRDTEEILIVGFIHLANTRLYDLHHSLKTRTRHTLQSVLLLSYDLQTSNKFSTTHSGLRIESLRGHLANYLYVRLLRDTMPFLLRSDIARINTIVSRPCFFLNIIIQVCKSRLLERDQHSTTKSWAKF